MSGFPLRFVESGRGEAAGAAGPVYAVHSWRHLGDSIISAGAVHNVKAAHPEMRFAWTGHAPEVWEHNPDVVHREVPPPDVYLPRLHYGSVELERQAARGTVVEGFTRTLCDLLGVPPVPCVTRVPYAVLSEEEKERAGRWRGALLLNANAQTLSFSKGYPHWQEVVDALAGRYTIIQVGSRERCNRSPDLRGVEDWRGRTENVRDFMVMAAGCDGIVSPPSALVNIAAAFGKKGVVLNGARELAALTAYPGMAHVSAYWPRCGSGADWACIALRESGHRACAQLFGNRAGWFAACMEAIDPHAVAQTVVRVMG